LASEKPKGCSGIYALGAIRSPKDLEPPSKRDGYGLRIHIGRYAVSTIVARPGRITFSSAERSVGKPVFDAAHDLDLVFAFISVIHGRQWAADIPALNVVPIGAAVYLR